MKIDFEEQPPFFLRYQIPTMQQLGCFTQMRRRLNRQLQEKKFAGKVSDNNERK